MATFTNSEYADIMFMYGKADGNATAARRLYQESFPERRLPNVQVFINTYQRLSESGSLHRRECGFLRYTPEIDEQILRAFEADPTTSLRRVAALLNINLWKVWSVMHFSGKHPFHYTPVQGLQEGDPRRRIMFCRFMLNADIEDRLFLKSVLWTDESKFTREGITNFHNLHYWAEENPHMKRT